MPYSVRTRTRGYRCHPSRKRSRGYKAIVCDASVPETLLPVRKEDFDTIIEFPGAVKTVYDSLGDSVGHIIGCGSLWMYGAPELYVKKTHSRKGKYHPLKNG